MTGARKNTPSVTPLVLSPRGSSLLSVTGSVLLAPATLLTPGGPIGLEPDQVIVMGRDPACTVVLADPLVSFRHARIVILRTGILLTDTSSRNGVYVNGVRIESAVLLCNGDRVLLGTTELSIFA